MQTPAKFLRNYGDTDFITGMRAIAVSMVIIVHTAAFAEFGILGQTMSGAGKYGVDMFFVISGFTIAKTFTDAQDYRSYLTRRIIRILPLYWFVICVATLLIITNIIATPGWMDKFGSQPNFYNFFMHLSMLSFLDYKIANSIIGVEWSIPIEVFWYICMPAVISLGTTYKKAASAILVILILTAILSYASKKMIGTSLPIKWMPIAYGHLFFLGVLSYHLRAKYEQSQSIHPKLWLYLALILYTIAMTVSFGGRGDIIGLLTAIIIIFLTPRRMTILAKILTLKPMLFLGSISYSLYLWHFLVISILQAYGFMFPSNLANFFLVYSLTIAISSLTYLTIEKTSNDFGRKFVKRRKIKLNLQ